MAVLRPLRGSVDAPVSLALAQSPAGLHVLLQVFDEDTRFAGPDGTPGDHVELRFANAETRSSLRIMPVAPGRLTHAADPGGRPAVQYIWQPLARGWNLELRIPLRDRPDALGVSVFDVDGSNDRRREYSIAGRAPLVAPDPELSGALRRARRRAGPGSRARRRSHAAVDDRA